MQILLIITFICLVATSHSQLYYSDSQEEMNRKETAYRGKYAFAVDRSTPTIFESSDEIHSVHIISGIRECDVQGGAVSIVSFYKGKKLLKSYSLLELFPDIQTWQFHPATGVFGWTLLSFDDKFSNTNFSILTVKGWKVFSLSNGELKNKPSEQDKMRR